MAFNFADVITSVKMTIASQVYILFGVKFHPSSLTCVIADKTLLCCPG